MADALTTELDAVNIILGAIGEAPVSTLAGTLPVDVSVAYACLTELRKRILSSGWNCNTEDDVQLALDGSNHAVIPPTALKVTLSDGDAGRSTYDIVQRGTQLYDKKNHTYVFTRAPKCNIVYLLTWDELPEQLRAYVALKAARVNQSRTIGSPELAGFTQMDEMELLVIWREADADGAKYNLFNNADSARFYQYRRA